MGTKELSVTIKSIVTCSLAATSQLMHGFYQQSAIFLNTDGGITGSESHLPLQKSLSDRVTLHSKEIFSLKERKLINSSAIQIMKQQKV